MKRADPALEGLPLLERERVRLRDDRDNVDNFGQLLHDSNVDLERKEAPQRVQISTYTPISENGDTPA